MSEQEKRINKTIAESITRLLRQKNRTQLELAEFLGVTQATVSNWCTGVKMPRMDKIDAICSYFGVSRSHLMGSSEPSSSESSVSMLSGNEQQVLDMYRRLDADDRAEVRGFIKGLLSGDKYKEGSPELKAM